MPRLDPARPVFLDESRVDSLAKAIGAALETATPDERAANIRHAGYHST
jgi:hypothetical protein